MSARLLFEVALRVLGMWFLFQAIVGLTAAVSQYMTISSVVGPNLVGPNMGPYFVSSGVIFAVQLALGVALIRQTHRISARFYSPDSCPPDAQNLPPQLRIGAGDVYHIACFVLGAYLLVQGLNSAGQFVVGATTSFGLQGNQAYFAVTAIVNIASGLVLIFGSRGIGQLLSNLRHDPDSIPQQQFSIKLLLIITTLVAMFLGVIKMFAV